MNNKFQKVILKNNHTTSCNCKECIEKRQSIVEKFTKQFDILMNDFDQNAKQNIKKEI